MTLDRVLSLRVKADGLDTRNRERKAGYCRRRLDVA